MKTIILLTALIVAVSALRLTDVRYRLPTFAEAGKKPKTARQKVIKALKKLASKNQINLTAGWEALIPAIPANYSLPKKWIKRVPVGPPGVTPPPGWQQSILYWIGLVNDSSPQPPSYTPPPNSYYSPSPPQTSQYYSNSMPFTGSYSSFFSAVPTNNYVSSSMPFTGSYSSWTAPSSSFYSAPPAQSSYYSSGIPMPYSSNQYTPAPSSYYSSPCPSSYNSAPPSSFYSAPPAQTSQYYSSSMPFTGSYSSYFSAVPTNNYVSSSMPFTGSYSSWTAPASSFYSAPPAQSSYYSSGIPMPYSSNQYTYFSSGMPMQYSYSSF